LPRAHLDKITIFDISGDIDLANFTGIAKGFCVIFAN